MGTTEERLLEMDGPRQAHAQEDPGEAYPVQQQFQFSRGGDAPPGVTFRNGGDPLVVRLDAPCLRLARVQMAFQEAMAEIEQRQADAPRFPVDQDDLSLTATAHTTSVATAHTSSAATTTSAAHATSAATASDDRVARPRVAVHHGPAKDPGLLADSIDGLPE